MPWECVEKEAKWHTVTKEDGETVGTHETEDECKGQVEAMYAEEGNPGPSKRPRRGY